MRRLKILWGMPAGPSETEVIYGGCIIQPGRMQTFGYVCSQCEAELERKPSYEIPRAYVLEDGQPVPL